jgi:ferrous iron transport protein A
MNSVTLDNISPGWKVRVTSIKSVGPLRKRLIEMGILRGTMMRVMRVAPLGDPIEIKMRGCNLSLRKSEAAGIEVERICAPCEGGGGRGMGRGRGMGHGRRGGGDDDK